MERVRQGDVDGLDVRIGEQRLVRSVGPPDPVLRSRTRPRDPRVRLPTATISTASVRRAPRSSDAGDAAGPEDAPADGLVMA